MSDLNTGKTENKKRKRGEGQVTESTPQVSISLQISQLEDQILESRKNYNNITKLLQYVQIQNETRGDDIFAALSLCRVFHRLMISGNMSKSHETSKRDAIVIQWLLERYSEYKAKLLAFFHPERAGRSSIALQLFMQLIKSEALQLRSSDHTVWRDGIFPNLLRALIENPTARTARNEFIEKYLKQYDDVRYYTYGRLTEILSEGISQPNIESIISIAVANKNPPQSKDDIREFFISRPINSKHSLYSPVAHRKQAQQTWMAIMRHDLTRSQRKIILELVPDHIAPWFLKIELLLDFLTDSFNVGGSTPLTALSGLFYLIQEKNLDYPQFYSKLYSLLDSDILHSKYRPGFLRLLDTFLASTHLSAALVASFIKRLSRLTLYAPPSGIVVVVPWIYNLLKKHPTCTFMIHRKLQVGDNKGVNKTSWADPFCMEESDPMETGAIESSLWEIQMLQSHYHPNVATVAKIISEQFTKERYDLEDFLNHSYGSMLYAEFSKDIKKAPEVEYEIPQKIFLKYDADMGRQDSFVVKLWDFS